MALLNPSYDNDSLHDKFVKTVKKNYTIYVTFDHNTHLHKDWETPKPKKINDPRLNELLKTRKSLVKTRKASAS